MKIIGAEIPKHLVTFSLFKGHHAFETERREFIERFHAFDLESNEQVEAMTAFVSRKRSDLSNIISKYNWRISLLDRRDIETCRICFAPEITLDDFVTAARAAFSSGTSLQIHSVEIKSFDDLKAWHNERMKPAHEALGNFPPAPDTYGWLKESSDTYDFHRSIWLKDESGWRILDGTHRLIGVLWSAQEKRWVDFPQMLALVACPESESTQ